MKNVKKGFTIVELVIVIAVIAILAGVLIPTFSGVVGKANESARNQEMTNALKVTLAGNAATGALAEGTVFVIQNGSKLYASKYNGNKLGEIKEFDNNNTYSPDDYQTVIIGTSESNLDSQAVTNVGKLFGSAAEYSDGKIKLSFDAGTTDDKELKVIWNVDFSKGTVVLYPAN